MRCMNANWTPAVMLVMINSALGLVNALVKETLDGGLDHMIVATYRLAISTVFLAPIAYFWERKTRPKLTLSVSCQLFFSALLGASLTQYFFLLGLSYTSATLSCAFLSMMPAITFIMALVFRQEKLNLRSKAGCAMISGTLVCIGGALLLTFYKGLPLTNAHTKPKVNHSAGDHSRRTENWVIGCLFLLTGSTFFSSWMLVQAKINRKYPCQYSSTVILSFFGTFQCALLSLIKTRYVTAWIVKNSRDIITIVYAGAVGQGVCTVGMSWCLNQRGPVFTSTFSPLILIFAALFDFSILHRPMFLGSVVGSIFVIAGLYVFLWGKTRDMEDRQVKLPSLVDQVVEPEEEEDYKAGRPAVLPTTP